MTGGQADVAVDALDALPDRIEVRHRLAHPHEHDVAHAALDLPARCAAADDLLDDLARGEVAGEAGLTGGAEPARHRTTGLTADADGRAVGVEHQDRFDAAPTLQLPEELDGVAGVADRLCHRRQCGREITVEPGPERLRQVGDVGGVSELAVEPVPQLVQSVPRFTVQMFRQLVARQPVARRSGREGHERDAIAGAIRRSSGVRVADWTCARGPPQPCQDIVRVLPTHARWRRV